MPTSYISQLQAVLWKNLMLKQSHILSFMIELFLPVFFMSLLIYIKSITVIFDSPSIAYSCGNSYPWFYSSSLKQSITSLIPFSCVTKPYQCEIESYYMVPAKYNYLNQDLEGYLQYGYIQSPATSGTSVSPFYTYTIADESTIYTDLMITNPSIPFYNMIKRLIAFHRRLGISPKYKNDQVLNKQIDDFITYLEEKFTFNRNKFIKLFDCEADLKDYILSVDYDNPKYGTGKIAYAIVFNQINADTGLWDYSIRVNYTSPVSSSRDNHQTVACLSGSEHKNVTSYRRWRSCEYTQSIPTTKYHTINLFKPQTAQFFNGYLYSGYSTIQQTVDEYIFSLYGSPVKVIASVSPFPTTAFVTDTFQLVISSTLGIYYMLSFLYPVSQIVKALVVEKETRVKEGMKMMGLTDTIYNLSWLILLIFQMTLISILITIVTADSVFKYSDKILVFIFFESFSFAVIGLCFLLATLFSRSKVASLIAPIIFFGSFFPFFAVSNAQFNMSIKAWTCLSAPVCFALGATVFADFEGGQVGIHFNNMSQTSSNFSYFLCIRLLLLDAVIYSIIAWYLDKVLPSEFGTPLPFYFFFQPSYWSYSTQSRHLVMSSLQLSNRSEYSKVSLSEIEMSTHGSPITTSNKQTSKWFEPVPNDLLQQNIDNKSIQIKNLRKVYKTTVEDRIAVTDLTADMYEDQITVLLGHNGAGKSTTINMIVGLTPPTSGEAYIQGKRITVNMQEIRQGLGVCPQHDILFAELTVLQHLQIFAAFKGVKGNVKEVVMKMISEVGLLEKTHVKASALSGGQKRKLSLGIAFIGDSSVVILDEPTSGMDPYSRRSTWDVIQRNKKGRIILLTTHFMDEADILADRILIMSEGKLQVAGSPLFLKGVFGVGYTLNISKLSQSQDSAIISSVVTRYISEAEAISNVGAEQSFRLPFSASSQFPELFQHLEQIKSKYVKEYGISVTTLEEVFIRVGKGLHTEIDDNSHINHMPTMHANSSSESNTSRLLHQNSSSNDNDNDNHSHNHNNNHNSNNYSNHDPSNHSISRTSNKKDSIFIIHLLAQLRKRFVYGIRDRQMMLCQLVLPVLLVIFGLSILLILVDLNQPDLILSPAEYNPSYDKLHRNYVPISISHDDNYHSINTSQQIFSQFDGIHVNGIAVDTTTQQPLVDIFQGCSQGAQPLFYTNNFLLQPQSSIESGASRYGAITLSSFTNTSNLVYNVLVNESAIHGVGVYVNLLHTAYLQVKSGIQEAKIITHNYPLPRTNQEHLQAATANAFVASLFLSIAFCFIPGSYATFIVKEYEIKARFQQVLSGANMSAYWFANLIWDCISYTITAVCIFIVLYLYNVDSFISGESGVAFVLLLFLFGPAVASFTYMTSFPFSNHSTAQLAQMLGNFVTGLCLMITHFVMTAIPNTSRLSYRLRYVFRLFPSFCISDGLLMLALCSSGSKCVETTLDGYRSSKNISSLSWEVTGANITFMAIEMVVYFLITLLIEYLLSFPILFSWLHYVHDPGLSPKFFKEEDIDVASERNRVESENSSSSNSSSSNSSNDSKNRDVVRLIRLRKVYLISGSTSLWSYIVLFFKFIWKNQSTTDKMKIKVAVQSLSLNISKGECFGLLGINGSGKTTTISILCGAFPPTSGTAYIDGYDVRMDQSTVRRKIGYCPQFDALLELLTVREHLELFASIKGISHDSFPMGMTRAQMLKQTVENKLDQLDLRDFENKTAGSLSGGNKRKLSVAIALIGDPSIVYLDEPSTGMDPVARRFMWDVISKVSTQDARCSVILTTHSMEEAEALCTRIGVMVNGRLRCLGSTQHLKERFGNGFEVNVKTVIPSEMVLSQFYKRFYDTCMLTIISSPTTVTSTQQIDSSDIRIAYGDIYRICAMLGNSERAQLISDHSEGRLLYKSFETEGSVSLSLFASWWIAEDQAHRLDNFLQNLSVQGLDYVMLSRSTAHSFRYRIVPSKINSLAESETNESKELNSFSLVNIFAQFEANKGYLEIQEYSISQTTLEQIFNQLAASDDNPEISIKRDDDDDDGNNDDGNDNEGNDTEFLSLDTNSSHALIL